MKVLNSVRSENIISIDIETVRVAEKFEDLDKGTQSAWEYKNKQDGEVPSQEDLSDKWEKQASLYAEFSKVCAVSVVFLHDGKLYCKEFYGKDEQKLLTSLSATLNNISAKSSSYRLVGHAAKYFDYPFLAKRFIIGGMQIPDILDVTNAKPWEQMNLCTNELWRVGGTGAGSSLQALCNVLSIPVSKVDLVGDEVGAAFYRGELERIGRYCSLDTIATYNVVRKLKQEPIFTFEEAEYVLGYSDEVQNTEEVEEVPLLKKLYSTKQFNQEVKNFLKKSKILKKDRSTVEKLVLASYLEQIDVMAQNKKELNSINEQRTTEVKEFFKTL